MAISRFFSSVADKFQKGPFYSEESNLPGGGRSGYHPEAQQRVRRSRITGTQAQRAAAQSPVFRGSGAAQFGQPGYTGYSVGYQAAPAFTQPGAPLAPSYTQPGAPQAPVTTAQSALFAQPPATAQPAGYRQGANAYRRPETAAQSAVYRQPMAAGQNFPLPQSMPAPVQAGAAQPRMGLNGGYAPQTPAASMSAPPAGSQVQIPGMQRPVTFQAANSQPPVIYQRPGFAGGDTPSEPAPAQPAQRRSGRAEIGYSGGIPVDDEPTQRSSVAIPVTPSGYQGLAQPAPQPNRGKAVKNRYAAQGSRYGKGAADGGYQQNFAQKQDKPYQSKFQLGGDTGFGVKQREDARKDRAAQPSAPVQPSEPFAAQPQPFQPTAQQAMQPWQPPVQPAQPVQPMQPAQQPDNLSYMPNMFVGNDGTAYRHVERLTQPMSASTCYRLIEFMRNGESVIVNTELIRDERENQRCLDLLYGAAYTMNCTFTRISARSIYLIAPATVTVIAYESIRQMNEQDAAVRWPGAESAILSGKRPKRPPVFGNYRAVE